MPATTTHLTCRAELPRSYGDSTTGRTAWTLIATLDGRSVIRDGAGRTLDMRRGDVVLIAPGVSHAVSSESDLWVCVCASFSPHPAERLLGGVGSHGLAFHRLRPDDPELRDRICATCERLHRDASWPGSSAPADDVAWEFAVPRNGVQAALASNAIEEIMLLGEALAGPPQPSAETGDSELDPRVRQVLALMAVDPARQDTLAQLARAVHLSPSRLTHIFTEQTGESPTTARLNMRLDRAAHALEDSDVAIKAIADELGFSSTFYFSRRFHQRFGMSPSRFRRSRRTR